MQERRQPEIIAGRVNADGSIATGDGFTVAKNSTGNYTVSLPANFRLISVTFATYSGATTIVGNGTIGTNIFGVLELTASTGAAIDGNWGFIAVGTQT